MPFKSLSKSLGFLAFIACQNACTPPANNGPDNKPTETQTMRSLSNEKLRDPDRVTLRYPQTPKSDHVDTYFGQQVADPYRWLEASIAGESPEVKQWLDQQERLAQAYLNALPMQAELRQRFEALFQYPRKSTPFKRGDWYYQFRNDGKQQHAVLYRFNKVQGQENLKENLVIDPNQLSQDGKTSLAGLSFSEDYRYLSYTLSEGGSDWQTAQILDLSGPQPKLLEDKVQWLRYTGMAWYRDGFFYSRYPEPEDNNAYTQQNEFHEVYYHKIGTPQSQDQLVFADRRNPKRMFGTSVSKDQKLLFLSISEGTKGNALYYKRLDEKTNLDDAEFIPLVETFDRDFRVIGNDGDKVFIYTDHQAPNYRLVEVDLNKAQPQNWKELIVSSPQRVLSSVIRAGDYFAAVFTQNVSEQLSLHRRDGSLLKPLELPNLINITSLESQSDQDELFFSYESYLNPQTTYRLSLKDFALQLLFQTEVPAQTDHLVAEQVRYKSKDGTEIPMTLVYKKGLERRGDNPVYLYGYGGFNISLMPSFKVSILPFLEAGGIYAVANLRGGGEFGTAWHQAGQQLQKQNVFDDFIAAAEYLIEQKYTNPARIAISGRSNGGLLVGACMTQRPELFRVALPQVGVLDMLRFQHFTIGRAWTADYGNSEDSLQFKNLLRYSPLHNARPANYPATMISTADRDDRVVPAHSFKFAAALQAAQRGTLPVILRLDRKAGHGAGKPLKAQIEEAADEWSFVFFNLKMNPVKDKPSE